MIINANPKIAGMNMKKLKRFLNEKMMFAHIAFERRELLLVEGDGQVHLLHWHFLSQS